MLGKLAVVRKDFLKEWFSKHKGQIADENIIEFLKNHKHQMCKHDLEGLEICWSYLLKVEAFRSLLCIGRPCKNEYVEIPGV